MGQKTNANIYRLGFKQNEWNFQNFENNTEEFTLYNFQNFNIKNYILQFFKKHKSFIQKCKINFNKTNMYIYITYYQTHLLTDLEIIKLYNKKTKQKKKMKTIENRLNLSYFVKYVKLNVTNKKKNLLTKNKRIYKLKLYKKFKNSQTIDNSKILTKNLFIEQLLESLTLFTNKKFHIFITLQNLNRGLSISISKKEQKFLKKYLLFFKRYSKNKFFKNSLNICYLITKIKNSSTILAEFLAYQLNLLKKHNYFLLFLKKLLTLLIKSKYSKIKGIKLIISGRFNGAPRSKSRTILIGSVPIQTIKKNIDYNQTVSYTKNGTFGVKVWIN